LSLAIKHYDPYQDAEERNIRVFEAPINNIRGYYQRTEDHVAILVDSRMGYAQKRCVVAHEVAHDRYSSGPIRKPETFMERIEYQKHEYFIDRKAAENLMDTDTVLSFIHSNPDAAIYDLADHFSVTERLARIRIEALKLEGLL
jgi:Zn-dependent peptidase ImmA (M78 family)